MDRIDRLQLALDIATARREQTARADDEARDAELRAELALLQAQARPSTVLRQDWIRAFLDHDMAECDRLLALMYPRRDTRVEGMIAAVLGAPVYVDGEVAEEDVFTRAAKLDPFPLSTQH